MSRCIELKEYVAVATIMDMLLSDDACNGERSASMNEFNLLFSALSHIEMEDEAAVYLSTMSKDCGLRPDIDTFCALIRGCAACAHFDRAQQYFEMMRTKFGIEPNEAAYCELLFVYARAHKKGLVNDLFNEYLGKVRTGTLSSMPMAFHAYLSVYANVGDVNGMLHALQLLTRHKVQYTSLTYVHIMRGYHCAMEYAQCVRTFEELVRGRLQVHASHLMLKCSALSQLMSFQSSHAFDEKLALYQEIEHALYHQRQQFGIEFTGAIARHLFTAAIALYHNVNPRKIIHIFERLRAEQWLCFTNRSAFDQKLRLDLHGYHRQNAQFLIRYLLAFELTDATKYTQWLRDVHGEFDEYWVILTGRGKHSTQKPDSRQNLREFVIEELMSYEPPIKAEIDRNNPGQLLVHASALQPHIGSKQMMDLLTKPSYNWVLNDHYARKKQRRPQVVKYCYLYNRQKRYRDKKPVSTQALNKFASIVTEGKEIELYDEDGGAWKKFTVGRNLGHDGHVLYDENRDVKTTMRLDNLLPIAC